MFFRRGRLSAKKARALLIALFDQRYQWPLRLPIVHLLARGDPLRFLCALRFTVDGIGEGVFLLNRRQPPQQTRWFANDLEAAVAELAYHPVDLAERLAFVMRLDDPATAEVKARQLLLEIIDLTPKEKRRGQQETEFPVVSWLSRIADLEPRPELAPATGAEQADFQRIARRAVRIVWRLPGSRLAALTGSVDLGYADLISDIDVSLFGLKLPKADVRRSLIAATSDVPDDITQLTQERYAADTFWLKDRPPGGNSYLINVRYFLIEDAQRLIEHPVPESRADEELLAHLSTAQILVDYESRGPDLLQNVQKATRQARFERMARASASLDQALSDLQVSSAAPDIFYATTQAILALLQLLAARNDRWIVFPKWTSAWFNDLQVAPNDVHERLSKVALLPFRQENVVAKLETLRALRNDIQVL